jgi:hypothetical protein
MGDWADYWGRSVQTLAVEREQAQEAVRRPDHPDHRVLRGSRDPFPEVGGRGI